MSFAAVRNMICVVFYLCLRVILDVLMFFFIDLLFGCDIHDLSIETLAYALDMREWYPVLIVAVIREMVVLIGADKRVKNAGNEKERMCVGVGRGGSARRMMVEEEEEYVDCKDGGDVQGEDEDEKQDGMEYELEWLFVDEGGESEKDEEGRRVNLQKECYDMFKDSYLGLVGLFREDVRVHENEEVEEVESDFGLVDLFGEDGVYLEGVFAGEDERKEEEFPTQCYDLLQEILLELEGSSEVFADEVVVNDEVIGDEGETEDDDDVVRDEELVLDEEVVEDVVVDVDDAEVPEEEQERDGEDEVDVMAGNEANMDERVETETGVNEGEGRMLMYESERDEIETEYGDEDIKAEFGDSDEEYLGDGEESYDSGLERSEGLAKHEEKYERRSIEDLILFFEGFSK